MIKTKKQMFIVIAIFTFLVILGGTAYAWFNYKREGTNQTLITGNIYLSFEEDDEISLSKIFPESKEEARARNDNYLTFEINGINESNKTIYYEIDLNHGTSMESPYNRFNDEDLRFDLVELDSNGDEVRYLLNAVGFDTLVNKKIWADEVTAGSSTEVSKRYKLRMWLSEDVLISDSDPNRDYYATDYKNHYANIKLSVIGDFNEKTLAFQKVKAAIDNKKIALPYACNNITWTDIEDGVVYLSGNNTCLDFNYVWYSGKLWRITAIYPDGAMKLVIENEITSIFWGSNVEYDGSWVYQWLNEDFYNTLYNANSIIDNVIWNYSTDNSSPPRRPETIENQKMKTAPVGLLSAYEYYNSYRCIYSASCTGSAYGIGYLVNGYNWWLLTPYTNTAMIRTVDANGYPNDTSGSNNSLGVRPAIVIKSTAQFSGNGLKDSPFEIIGDKEKTITDTTLISSRTVGEYVIFDDDLYRIVEIDNGITKLTRIDYLRDESNNNEIMKKYLASSTIYGKSSNTQSDDYWDYYLNNTWYNNIGSDYKNMLVDGIYYLGTYVDVSNYKSTICKDVDLNNVTTVNCTRYTSSDTDKTFTGKVGILRVGEMFSSQLAGGNLTSSVLWLITPASSTGVRYLDSSSLMHVNIPSYNTVSVRPIITLKSGIKITGGTGMENDPFEISE